MASGRLEVGVARAIRTLCEQGAVGGLGDAQLVARFVDRPGEAAEAAFEALVQRHGPMVLRVGLDVLGDRHSAEDAFQATFLVLARKAGSIGRPEALGPWLYGVAHRVARKARGQAQRRRRHERRAAEASSGSPEPGDGPGDGARALLHEEVARLPEACRSAVVLCYFQGMTYDLAARHLGVTEPTVRGRLARARRALRVRLARRGLAVPAIAGAAAPAWAVPARLVGPSARAASRFARGQGAPSAAVAGLAEGVSRAISFSKWKAAALLAGLQVAVAAGVLAQQGGADRPAGPTEAGTVQAPAEEVPLAPELIRRPEGPGPVAAPARLGLTLDAAIERMLREDPDVSPARFEVSQARADGLTAGLRANPVFYADAQLVPFGEFAQVRPGGQTQYDVNISRPLDFSAKRRARKASANRARVVTEAQYLDAVRLRVEGASRAFVDALTARDLDRLRRESAEESGRLTDAVEGGAPGSDEARRAGEARSAAASGRDRAAGSLDRALRALAAALKLPGVEAAGLDVLGELEGWATLPSAEVLTADAMAHRPDLAAVRLGLDRAEADLRQRRADRLPDFYVLQQPYTFWLNTPPDPKSPTSYTLDLTVPLPLDRVNQGDVQRAKLNVAQSQGQQSALERQVAREVWHAHRECERSGEVVRRAAMVDVDARKSRDLARAEYLGGGRDLASLLAFIGQADDAARLRVEAAARLRGAQAGLNAAVGRRVLP